MFAALGKGAGESLIFCLHGLEQDKLLEEERELHLGVLQVGLEAVLFLLHLSNFLIEGDDQLLDLLLDGLFLENELDVLNLSEFVVDISSLDFSSLAGKGSDGVQVDRRVVNLVFLVLLCLFFRCRGLLLGSGGCSLTLTLLGSGLFVADEL